MTARIFDMMTGDMSAGEARRMISEKQMAYSNAQMSGARALLTGGPVEAGMEMFDVYRRAVRANCNRLAKAH
ncbi:MAG: hypothetical protein ABSE22_15715 [Xanthobacteraceae bacterium]|jgi:hypothetical protein